MFRYLAVALFFLIFIFSLGNMLWPSSFVQIRVTVSLLFHCAMQPGFWRPSLHAAHFCVFHLPIFHIFFLFDLSCLLLLLLLLSFCWLLLLFCCLPPPWIYFFNFIKIMEMNEILIRCCALHLHPLPHCLIARSLPAACDIFWTNEFNENCSRRATPAQCEAPPCLPTCCMQRVACGKLSNPFRWCEFNRCAECYLRIPSNWLQISIPFRFRLSTAIRCSLCGSLCCCSCFFFVANFAFIAHLVVFNCISFNFFARLG